MKKAWKKAFAAVLAFAMVVSCCNGFATVARAAADNEVTVSVSGSSVVIGNEYISREFSTADNKLSTVEITNKRTDGGNTIFAPAEGSEEFIIKVTKDESDVTTALSLPALDRTGWTATADSYQNASGASDGPGSNLLDGSLTSIWHTNYGGGTGDQAFPYNVVVTLNGEKTFRTFSYTPRQNGESTNGNLKGYEFWISTSDSTTALAVDDASWVKVAEGSFKYDGVNPIYVDLGQSYTATQVKLVGTSAVNGASFGGGAEFNLHEDAVPVVKDTRSLYSSDLTLTGDVKVEDTQATINGVEKTGKKITFNFAPYTFRDVEYTVSEVVVMYNGDHFMRKYLEISVPEAQQGDAEIDYIDLESFKVNASDAQWTIPTDAGGVVSMDMFKANLGQPIYIQGMFFGCEFPAADTQIVEGTGYMRYYTGKDFTRLKTDNQLTTDGKYVTWQTVAGAARSTEQQVIQADFFEYIYSIATPSEFRIQYNSWFDNMMLISDESILESFIEFDREISKAEARPFDSYVMDDGWINYNDTYVVDAARAGTTLNQTGFWEFNSKFPDGLTPSSELVNKFGSNFGLWVGPRGGYNFYGSLADIITKSGKGSKAGGSIDVADRVYIQNFTEMACDWQDKYDINYWKWDGFADSSQYNAFAAVDGVAAYSETNHHMTGGFSHMYHVTDLWEGWIDMIEILRANAANNPDIENLWINLTCYTNPSPWFLQWANSVWMQCVYDQKDADFGLTKMNKQITYRDAMYYDFLVNHEFQFPLANLFNHDPIYGKEGTGMNINTATDDDFQNYLYMLSTRGTAFWEISVSDSIMTDGKYEVIGEFLEWAEENFHMLRNAKYIGGAPDNTQLSNGTSSEASANAYGFSCFDGTDGIISLRNSSATENKTITFTFDRTMGVAEDAGTLKYHLEHGYLLSDGVATTGELKYGETYSVTLEPNEVRILMVSKDGDTTAPKMVRAYTDGEKVITVKFDEKVTASAFTVESAEIESVEASADDLTFRITLKEALANGASAVVTAADAKDKAGNACTETITVVHHKNNVVAKGATEDTTKALTGNNGFSVVADIAATQAGTVVAQGDVYTLAINEEGKVTFTLNGTTAVSDVLVNDGEKHTIAGVKENNGILKVYVDGTLAGAAYSAENRYYTVQAASITVGDMASMATVYDIAYGYDQIAVYGQETVVGNEIILKDDMITVSGTSEGSKANILDEDPTTFWTSEEDADGIAVGEPWLKIDLGKSYMLGQIDYSPRYAAQPNAYWCCTGNIEKIVVEVSADGTTWTEVTPEGGYDITDKIVATADESLFPVEISFDTVNARYIRISGTESYHWQEANANKMITVGDLKVFVADVEEVSSTVLAENAMANSEQWPAGYVNDGKAAWAFDDEAHWWHSRYQNWEQKADHEVGSAVGDGKPSETNPIWIQTGFGEQLAVDHITYQGRDNSMGIIQNYELSVAKLEDPSATPTDADFIVVKEGTLDNTNAEQTIQLDTPVNATHIRLTAYSAVGGDGHVAAQRIKVFAYDAVGVDAVAPVDPPVDPDVPTTTNLALNKPITGKWTKDNTDVSGNADRPLSMIVDGIKDNTVSNYGEFGSDDRAESAYVQIDLEALCDIESINMYRYWADGRTYKGTVIAISETEDFANPTIVYNSDADNFHGLGAGTDETYAETSDGKTIELDNVVQGRYVRAYMYGATGNTNHVVEIEVMGTVSTEAHTCVFDQQVATEEYLAAEADCEHAATYYYSCLCGEKGEATFEHGDPLGHDYEDGVCTRCGEEDPDYVAPKADEVVRLAGSNRWNTALKVADEMKANLGAEKFDAIIIASGNGFADALAGSYLSTVKNAPILLSWGNGGKFEYLDTDNIDYIKDNLAEGGTVYLLGGTSAVPELDDDELSAYEVVRLGGKDRFETNLMILEEAGVAAGSEVLVCTSTNFADSLSASATGLPILLVFNEKGILYGEQPEYLAGLENCTFTVIGGESAVSEELAAAIGEYGDVERLAGANRFETSALVAEKYFEAPEMAVLAYAWNYPDGLCGGALAYSMGAPLVLTMTNYEAVAVEYAESVGLTTGIVLGGDSLISDAAVRAIFAMDAETEIIVK